MNLRFRTLLIIIGTKSLLVAALYVLFSILLLEGFHEIEDASVVKDLERVERAIDGVIENIKTKTTDWSNWDDTYRYMKDHNQAYLKSNLQPEGLLGLQLHYLLFFDGKGKLIQERALDLEAGEAAELPQAVRAFFKADSPLVHQTAHHPDGQSGLALLSDGSSLLFAALPILTSVGEGPARGTLVFARQLDQAQLKQIARSANVSLQLQRADNPALPEEFARILPALGKEPRGMVQPLNEDRIVGYRLYKDVFGKPALMMRIDTERDIFAQGLVTRNAMLFAVVLVGALNGLIMVLLLGRFITRRLLSLSREVEAIEKCSDAGHRVAETGNDEIFTLARRINEMLAALEQFSNELRSAKEAAEAASRAKSCFVANMSHEVRTPINGVLGLLQALQNLDLSREAREYVGMARASGEVLLGLVNDVLDFSKAESGKLTLERTDLKLQRELKQTLLTVALRAEEKGLALVCDVDHSVPERLLGDPVRLRQIIINLVGNAIKFTDQGAVVVGARLESRDEGGVTLHFTVRDTGIGIPRDKWDRIFEAFSQADQSTTRKYGGTGLGLTISRDLVNLMGGRIWVESEPGAGTTFHFTAQFPLDADQPAAGRAGYDGAQAAVLIVTRSEQLRTALSNWGGGLGLCTAAAEDLDAALSVVKRLQADGHGKVLALVGQEAAPDRVGTFTRAAENTRAVVLLGCGQLNRSGDYRSQGAAGVLTAPVMPYELERELECLLSNETGEERQSELVDEEQPAPKRTLSILVADDAAINRTVAQLLLSQWGHKVTLAENGRQALDQATSDHGRAFDMILMDVQMPVLDGIEATKLLRDHERNQGDGRRHVPVIALTAHSLERTQEDFVNAGMDGYITKPIDAKRLFAVIEELAVAPGAESAASAALVERAPGSNGIVSLDEAVRFASRKLGLDSTLFDAASQIARFNGQERLALTVVEAFLEDQQRLRDALGSQLEAGNTAQIGRAAHALRGALANASAPAAARLGAEIEEAAKNNQLNKARELGRRLEPMLNQLVALLNLVVRLRHEGDRAGDMVHPQSRAT